jgi:hypothetical protein
MHTCSSLLTGLLILPALATGGCGGSPSEPLPDAETRILFIGNSLTERNDLPGAVASVATALGFDVSTYGITGPNMALEDHYWTGVGEQIRALAPDLVVMQQGPSSLPENQLHLREWADTLSRIARDVGAEPALLMVWPELDRFSAFAAVLDSYLGAAEYVGGTFIPAGEALKRLHMTHPEITPYSSDRFHPNETGTVLAALVIVGTLFDAPVSGLPAVIPAGGGGRKVALLPEEWPVVPEVAQEVLDAGGGGGG